MLKIDILEVSSELKHLLLEVLPLPAVMAQGRLLCIQNHLDMVCDSLWAINSMIVIPEIRMLVNRYLLMEEQIYDLVLDVPVEFAGWETDVAAAVADVGELLSRITDWEASLHRSIEGRNTQQVLHFRHAILAELKEMLCHLNSLVLRGSAMGLLMDPMSSMNPLREDYSIVLKNEVVGREEDLEQLITIFQQQQLVSSDGDDNNNPFIIVIVGKQGVGKTTLAHMIYHHTWIRQQFHHRIWVDQPLISTFKTINIIGKEFTRSINNDEYCDKKLHLELPLQAMWEYINEQLDGSRYLLVLHIQGLASLRQQEWNELKNILLRVGGPGSAILVVLQSSTEKEEEEVSDMGFLNGEKDITTYCLKPLSMDAWLEVFKRHAVTTTIPSKQFAKQHFRNTFETFGAKFVGSLSHNFQAAYHLPDLRQTIYNVMNFAFVFVRLLKYLQLLDVNTADYDVISHMLTAEYLIPTEGLKLSWMEFYERIFEHKFIFHKGLSELVLQCTTIYLHMMVPEESTTIPKFCRYLCLKINPTAIPFRLPTMPVEVSKKLIALILQEGKDEATPQEDDEKIILQVYKKRQMKAAIAISKFLDKMLVRLVHLHMLVVETSMIQRLPSEISKLVNLRCLHLTKLKMELLPKSLFDLPNLRILSLLHCEKLQKISERIHKLKKLQILKLAYCIKLQWLPKSIIRLKNLEVLDVEGCCWLNKLPEDLVCFKSLRILNVAKCASLSQIPHGIEQLIDLHKLSGTFIDVDGDFGLTQLQALTNLQDIRLQNLERVQETQTEMLMAQQSLLDLSLHWGGEETNASSKSATSLQVFEALRPNVHLKRLEIISYKGVEFPTWMSKQQLAHFDSLVQVRLINLRRCATLPSLGQLPKLQILEISGMDLITHIDDTFYGDDGQFPKLTKLTFSEMLALEKWYVPKRQYPNFFPELRQLTLIQCPKLKEIDQLSLDYHDATIRVWLNNETIWSIEFCRWGKLRYIRIIEIVGCQELKCLPQDMQSLKSLYKMTINSCNNLTTLVALDSLEELYLYACPVLAFNLEAFTKLKRLKIKDCPKMQIYHNAWKKHDEKHDEKRRREDEEEEKRRREEEEEEVERWWTIEEEKRWWPDEEEEEYGNASSSLCQIE